MEFGVRVAEDAHVVDGPSRERIERLPDPQRSSNAWELDDSA